MDKYKCVRCGGKVKYYDCVKRIVREKNGVKRIVLIERYHCIECGFTHRYLPDDILPYKQYRKEIIDGVVEGLITPDTLGFEDYPSEMTMKRWKDKYH